MSAAAQTGAAAISATIAAVNAAVKPKGYQCLQVGWEDSQRATIGGSLSSWGANITDVRLWAKGGQLLYVVRTQNWNERLGFVRASDLAVVVGNGGRALALSSITLENFLRAIGEHAAYAGLQVRDLSASQDDRISIRFQTVFLPIGGGGSPTFEFCSEAYNYNTTSDADPRNLLVLCTPQGASVQQDGAGAKRIFYHAVDDEKKTHRYWLEAERSSHSVGTAQKETEAEAAAAAARGKSTAIHIGTDAMGTRFNVQMLIQIPLKQKPKPLAHAHPYSFLSKGATMCVPQSATFGGPKVSATPVAGVAPGAAALLLSADAEDWSEDEDEDEAECEEACFGLSDSCGFVKESFSLQGATRSLSLSSSAMSKKGVSNAARISRGSEVDVWPGLTKRDPERDPAQHITVTVTMYYTVAGGVPSEHDALKAVADLDSLYASCEKTSSLAAANATAGGKFTLELTEDDAKAIGDKVTTQPYKPPAFAAANNTNGFPK